MPASLQVSRARRSEADSSTQGLRATLRRVFWALFLHPRRRHRRTDEGFGDDGGDGLDQNGISVVLGVHRIGAASSAVAGTIPGISSGSCSSTGADTTGDGNTSISDAASVSVALRVTPSG